jgi:hypothetical protein
VWNSIELVWGSECASGGFVVSVCRHCVVVSRGNLVAAVLRTIHFFSCSYIGMFVIDEVNYYINVSD